MKHFSILATVLCLAVIPATAQAGCSGKSSQPSSQPADVIFENNTCGKFNVIWYKFNGGTKKYRTLAAGRSYVQATFTKHVWEVTDAKGKCISTLVVRHSQTFNIQ